MMNYTKVIFSKKLFFYFLVTIFYVSSITSCNKEKDTKTIVIDTSKTDTTNPVFKKNIGDIRSLYQRFNDAKLNKNDSVLYHSLNSASIEYYNFLLDKVLLFKASDFETASMYDQYYIFFIRANFEKDEILKMTSRDLIGNILNSSKDSEKIKKEIDSLHLQAIKLEGKLAYGKVNTNEIMEFNKENGFWKINYIKHIENLNKYYQNQMKTIGHKEFKEYLLEGKIFSNSKYKSIEPLLNPIKDTITINIKD